MPQSHEILLSVGIIFKNEIRSLERCLKALEPLRKAVPCEVVMADTGSSDGSREIAEKYADILIDFPWIDDFSAARNAVMDRCSGRWYMTVDSDEYLDENVSQLAQFVQGAGQEYIVATVTIRNYRTYEMDSNYADFLGVRLLRMSTGIRYQGKIHEYLPMPPHTVIAPLLKTVLHHDGYVGFGSEKGAAKLERNMTLLRKRLQTDPNNLTTRLQIIESGWREEDYCDQLREAVRLVKEKYPQWENAGPPIMRYAVHSARSRKMEELEEWTALAEERFPNSYYTRIDIEVHIVLDRWEKKDYDDCIRRGEKCLEAYADYRAGRGDIGGLLYSTLKMAPLIHEQTLKLIVANSYLEKGKAKKAVPLLESLDYAQMDETQTKNLVFTLRDMHSRSDIDTAPLVQAVWAGINEPVPSKNRARKRCAEFLSSGASVFYPAWQDSEAQHEGFQRHSYTLFRPLPCALGIAAAMLETNDPEEQARLCEKVEDWSELPIFSLAHALECGLFFPPPGRPMHIEDMDDLASRLPACGGAYSAYEGFMQGNYGKDAQTLAWARSLTLAFMRCCTWKNVPVSRALIQNFVQIERRFLPACYAPEALQSEMLFMLPPIHRFGWYCVQAFDSLENGNAVEFVRLLRMGLDEDESTRPMVEFLIEYTPELQAPPPSPELLELAEKVRTMLAAYPPDAPAVAALKASPAYQRVAHLIEAAEEL